MNDYPSISCPVSSACGGCSHIEVPYEAQLAAKQQAIERLFGTLCEPDAVKPILGMDDPQRYRNKIVSPFAPSGRTHKLRTMVRTGRAGRVALRLDDIATGLYAAGTHKLVACDDCPVELAVGRRVIAAVKQLMARYGMKPYDEDAGTGFVRHAMVRVGAHSGEVLVTLVTNGREFTGSRNFCRELARRCPEVTSIVQNINLRQTNAILGTEERVLYGPGFILDTLCGLSFRISSRSFYQVNAVQTEVLYRAAIHLALDGIEAQSILDAYCGTGTIGLVAAAASSSSRVVGVDSVEAAIADARQNAVHNGIGNASFAVADAGMHVEAMAAQGAKVDVVFLDPPRSGASEQFLDALVRLKPARVVYISCNPATQARDVRLLLDGGYRLSAVQPVDMFPHTGHIESVALLDAGSK